MMEPTRSPSDKLQTKALLAFLQLHELMGIHETTVKKQNKQKTPGLLCYQTERHTDRNIDT